MIQKFDEFDDARFNISDGESFLAFYYRRLFIKNDIRGLIDKYKESYKKSGEWGGGPVNREFDEYFKRRYKEDLLSRKVWSGNKPDKPSIALIVINYEAVMIMSFSLHDLKPYSVYPALKINDHLKKIFSSEIIDSNNLIYTEIKDPEILEMDKLWRSFYSSKGGKNLFELVEFFGLEPSGMEEVFGNN
jgi:hypothetical protein